MPEKKGTNAEVLEVTTMPKKRTTVDENAKKVQEVTKMSKKY